MARWLPLEITSWAALGNTEHRVRSLHSSLENLPLTVHSQIPDEDRALSDGSFWWLLRSSERSVHWAIRGRLKATESQKCSKRPLFPNEIDGNDCVVRLFMVIGKRLLYLLGRARGWQASNSVEMCSPMIEHVAYTIRRIGSIVVERGIPLHPNL